MLNSAGQLAFEHEPNVLLIKFHNEAKFPGWQKQYREEVEK